jgi:hypothetical protein
LKFFKCIYGLCVCVGTIVPGVQWFPGRTAQAAAAAGAASTASLVPVNVSPFVSGVQVLCAIRDLSNPSDAFQWDGSWFGHPGTELIDFYAGTTAFREMVDAGMSAEDIVQNFSADVELFKQRRKSYLLY